MSGGDPGGLSRYASPSAGRTPAASVGTAAPGGPPHRARARAPAEGVSTTYRAVRIGRARSESTENSVSLRSNSSFVPRWASEASINRPRRVAGERMGLGMGSTAVPAFRCDSAEEAEKRQNENDRHDDDDPPDDAHVSNTLRNFRAFHPVLGRAQLESMALTPMPDQRVLAGRSARPGENLSAFARADRGDRGGSGRRTRASSAPGVGRPATERGGPCHRREGAGIRPAPRAGGGRLPGRSGAGPIRRPSFPTGE
jgi:hypothetical protein